MQSELSYPFIYFNKMFFFVKSKTTKLILLDSLLQEILFQIAKMLFANVVRLKLSDMKENK